MNTQGYFRLHSYHAQEKKKFLLVEFAFLSTTRYFKKERNKQTTTQS